jgi:acetaldehyde dehydrogenase/alcohol dehydrogenase
MSTKKENVSTETTNHSGKTQFEELDALVARVQAAQKKFATFSQEKVDAIFRAASIAANAERISLAKEAVAETGMGIVEDKVIKNHFAAEYIYNQYRTTRTCGVIESDPTFGIEKVAEPIGVICGIIPTTNPTSTTIFKSLIALKTRNAIIFSPHPRAKQCTVHAAKIILDAAVKAGAPEDIIGWIETPTIELANALMHHSGINLILATGGPGMVKAAYSSGIPAIGVGAGNTPAVIDETADIRMAVNSILMSKTFDNGVVCASEQCLVVHKDVYDEVINEFKGRDGYVLSAAEKAKLSAIMMDKNKCSISPAIVGQPASKIAEMAGIQVPVTTKVLIGEIEKVGEEEPFAHEKLSPVLGMIRCNSFEEGTKIASQLVELGGIGHTSVLYTNKLNKDRIHKFGALMRTGRVLTNMPSSQGAIGDIYNFRLEPSLTLGCGSWGGNSVSENVGVKHLMNIKTVAEKRENMLWFRVPPKNYLKSGCLPVALQDLAGKKRAFIITDSALFNMGFVERITSILEPMGIDCECFHQVQPDPTLSTVKQGVELINAFKPDVIIALGGGSPMDAAKIIWMLYEHPEVDFEGLALRFMDIRKRIYTFPMVGQKAMMVAIPTTSGTGSEVTPFAVITDDRTGLKYPIADYSLTPDMAIVDADLVRQMPRSLVAAGGYDAIVHNIEAIVAVTATDYTTGLALESLRVLFKYLQRSYDHGAEDLRAQEKVHNAATMAGMAFANAFLGICHSMAHKLGAEFHIPHGIANALLLPTVVRFNASDNPTKQTAFPQYRYPGAMVRYNRIADYLGLGGSTPEEKLDALANTLEAMKASLNIPRTIQEYGISEKDFLARVDHLAEEAFDDQCTGTNPRYPLISELRELYLQAYYGK